MSTCDCLYVKCIGSVAAGQGGGSSLQTSDAWDPINSCIQRQIWLQMEVKIKGADESKGFQADEGRGGRGHVEALKARQTPNWELRTQSHLWSNHVFDAIKRRVSSASAQQRNPVGWLTGWSEALTHLIHSLILSKSLAVLQFHCCFKMTFLLLHFSLPRMSILKYQMNDDLNNWRVFFNYVTNILYVHHCSSR